MPRCDVCGYHLTQLILSWSCDACKGHVPKPALKKMHLSKTVNPIGFRGKDLHDWCRDNKGKEILIRDAVYNRSWLSWQGSTKGWCHRAYGHTTVVQWDPDLEAFESWEAVQV